MIWRNMLMLKGIIVVFALLIGTIAYADESAKDAEKKIVQGFKNIGKDAGKACALR